MKSRKSNSHRTLRFQQLEDRMLMAGNVTAAVKNGALTITGDNSANQIQITQVGPNSYLLHGMDGTTKINGKSTDQSFSGVTGDVKIDLQGGDDALLIGDGINYEATRFMSLPRNLNVTLGAGNNSFSMYGTAVPGNISVTGGANADTVLLTESNIGTSSVNGGANDCTINLGAGTNEITMLYTPVQRDLNILDQASLGDNIAIDGGNVGRYLYIQTGNGADSVQIDELNIGLKLQIATGDGKDNVILGGYDRTNPDADRTPIGIAADQVFIDLGKGDDVLQIGGSYDNHSAGGVKSNSGTILGGDGKDTLFDYEAMAPTASYAGFEYTYFDFHFGNLGNAKANFGSAGAKA